MVQDMSAVPLAVQKAASDLMAAGAALDARLDAVRRLFRRHAGNPAALRDAILALPRGEAWYVALQVELDDLEETSQALQKARRSPCGASHYVGPNGIGAGFGTGGEPLVLDAQEMQRFSVQRTGRENLLHRTLHALTGFKR